MSDVIKSTAKVLVDLHGEGAVAIALERVELSKQSGSQKELDMARMVMAEVEKLVKES